MKCAVTGANGFLGSHLVDRLLAEGHQVRALVRATADLRWLQGKPVELVHGDLQDLAAMGRAFDGAAVVYHVAGRVNARGAGPYFEVNAAGTRRALEACLQASPGMRRFVLVSSLSVMGPSADGAPIREDAPQRPINLYGRSKQAGEQEALRFADRLPLCILRPGPIYGPRDTEALPLIRLATRGLYPRVGLALRTCNFVHVEDVVQALLLAGEAAGAVGQALLVGSDENYTVAQCGKVMCAALRPGCTPLPLYAPVSLLYAAGALGTVAGKALGLDASLNLDRVRMLTARGWSMDISRARQVLGYAPRWGLAEGVQQTARWAREQGWL